MADTFTLEVVTPARQVVRETVSEAQIPVLGGYIGVLPGHTPLLAEMGIGELSYHAGNRVYSCTAIGGFVEVLADRVIVLADSRRARRRNQRGPRGSRPRPRPEAPGNSQTIPTWIGSARRNALRARASAAAGGRKGRRVHDPLPSRRAHPPV